MKARLYGLLVFAMIVPVCAAARGGHGGGGIGGVLVLLPILVVIGFGAYWILSRSINGKDNTEGHSFDALLFYALFGLMALIVSLPFILLGAFLWGAAYSSRISAGQALPGIILFGVICFFLARWLWRSVQSVRARAAPRQIK